MFIVANKTDNCQLIFILGLPIHAAAKPPCLSSMNIYLQPVQKRQAAIFRDSLSYFIRLARQFFDDITGDPNAAGARLSEAARNAGAVAADIQPGNFRLKPVVQFWPR